MPAAREKRWLVVVVPVRTTNVSPQQQGLLSQAAYVNASPPKVKEVAAVTAFDAAEAAGVPAGATAYVVALAHVTKLKRPKHAPLVAA